MSDCIVAPATPPGGSLRGLIRLSGEGALAVLSRLFEPDSGEPIEGSPPFRLLPGRFRPPDGWEVPIPGSVVLMRPPRSYTREPMAELYCPGNPILVAKLLEQTLAAGARMAGPGEFTRRAFENGRLSLSQAEAVLAVIDAEREEDRREALSALRDREAERVAAVRSGVLDLLALVEGSLDFSEEGISFFTPEELRGRIGKLIQAIGDRGAGNPHEAVPDFLPRVLLVGRANAGKSSLLNAWVGGDRHLVSAVPGTTRDLLEAPWEFQGQQGVLVDTPGLWSSDHPLDVEGQHRIERLLARKPFALLIFDRSEPPSEEDRRLWERYRGLPHLRAFNKCDLPAHPEWRQLVWEGIPAAGFPGPIEVSAATGEGVEELKRKSCELLAQGRLQDRRRGLSLQQEALSRARQALESAGKAVEAGEPSEGVALYLREGAVAFDAVWGAHTPDELLGRIFARFCIGK